MPPENPFVTNIKDLGVEGSLSVGRVYASAFIEGLDDVWPDFDKLRAEGITIDSDYPFIGASRTGRDSIERCDLFLGIYGFERKGHIGDIQKKEYRMARENGKPVLAFVHSGYLYNTPPIGVFDLLSLPQGHLTKVISFGPHEKLTEPVFREVGRFFANGGRFDVNDAPGAEEPASTERNSMPDATDTQDIDFLAEAISGYPDSEALVTGARLERAETLRAERRFVEALTEYDLIIKAFPENVEARLGLVEVLRELRRFDEALAQCNLIIEAFPENVEARLGRAAVLRDIKHLDDALADYGWVIRSHPENSDARTGRAEVLQEIGPIGDVLRADVDELIRTSEDPAPTAKSADVADENVPLAQGSSPPSESKALPSESPFEPGRIGDILVEPAKVQVQLGKNVLDTPMLLVGLLDREDDRVARAFLSSFGITREKLLDGLKTYYLKVILRDDERLVLFSGEEFPLTVPAAEALRDAHNLALDEHASEVQPRHLFKTLLSNTEDGDWIQTTLGKEVVGWISATLEDWDDATPITQAAVQAKLVEDDLFINPPTQRDSAAEKDLLGFEEYAEALVQIIRRPETRAPLVVGVYGPWGSGKSTFMGLVKRKLDALGQPAATETSGVKEFFNRQVKRLRGLFRKGERSLRVTTVDYDAWAYADAQKLWSGLVDKIAKELDAELTARDRIAYLINSHSRRLLAALALGLIPVALFALGYAAQHTSTWLSGLLSPVWNKPWLNLPGWVATAAWALYAYFLQKRPVTDAVAALASKFDAAPTAGLVSRIQDEFKTALQTRIDPEKKPKTVEALRTDIRQRVERNELKVVVFIDELDRCPLEKIVEILEAIKLFLAEDIFIVLLGVDTRVAAEAIRLHYKEVQNPNLPREYLEKIVQLPLRVPTARKQHIEGYLQSFMTLPEDGSKNEADDVRISAGAVAQQPSESNETAETQDRQAVTKVAGDAGPAAVTGVSEEEENASQPTTTAAVSTAPVGNVLGEATARTPYDVSALSRSAALPQMPDTKVEFDAMAAIARDFLDSNPRRIKRLLNTYRYVKILAARLPGIQVQTTRWQQTMLYWLAFTMKWPEFMGHAIEAAELPEAKNVPGSFLLGRRQKGESKESQPEAKDIEDYLPLSAIEVVEHYKLAPNFLIENPSADRKTPAAELITTNSGSPALPFLGF